MRPTDILDEIIAEAERDQRTNRMSTVSSVTISWLRLARRRLADEAYRRDHRRDAMELCYCDARWASVPAEDRPTTETGRAHRRGFGDCDGTR